MFPPKHPGAIAALAAALLAAVSIPCPGADEHYLTVIARTSTAGESDQSTSSSDVGTTSQAVIEGSESNSASARAWRNGGFFGDAWLFASEADLRADSGPQFSKNTFPGISRTITQALAYTRRIESFEPWYTPQFRMTYVLIDPANLIGREGKAGGFDMTFLEYSSFDPIFEVHATRSGARSITGTMGEGYKTMKTELFAGTGELKPSYRFGGEKSVEGRVMAMALLDFLSWSRAGQKMSDNIVSFVDTAIDLRLRADALEATAQAADDALLAMSNTFPQEFGKAFRVTPVAGKTDRYTISHRSGNDMASFATAFESSIALQKRLHRQHDDLVLRIMSAVEDGHYPPTALLTLNLKYPGPSSATARKFKQLSFFRSTKPRTQKEVDAVKKDFAAATRWLRKEIPALKKRVKRLDYYNPSLGRNLQDVYQDYDNTILDDPTLPSRQQAVLRTTLLFGQWAWRSE